MGNKGEWLKLILWGWMMVAIIGCNKSNISVEDLTPMPIIPTSTLPRIQPTITQQPIPPTMSALEIQTRMKFECVDEPIEYPFDGSIKGKILILGRDLNDEFQTFFLDLSNGQTENFSEVGTAYLMTSPDLTKFVYENSEEETISVIDIQRNIIGIYPLFDERGIRRIPAGWINNHTIAIVEGQWPYRYEEPFYLGHLLLWDIETNEFEEVYPEQFPSIRDFDDGYLEFIEWGVYRYTDFFIDPTLTRVLYVWEDHDFIRAPQIVLWDFSRDQELTRIYRDYYPVDRPIWNKTGDYFITEARHSISVNDEVYENFPLEGNVIDKSTIELIRVDRDGNLARLTYFSLGYYSTIYSLQISPDEEKLAFGFLNLDPRELDLSIYDFESGWTTNFCIDGGYHQNPAQWSPDSNYLIFESWKEIGDERIGNVLILNILTGELFEIYDSVNYIYGWFP